MKTFYIFALFFASFWQVNAQYCIPDFPSTCSDGDQIDSFTIGTAGFSDLDTGCSPTSYSDFYATKTITLSASVIYSFTVTHGYTSQEVRIWADFNNDNAFDEATELIGSGSSGGTYASTSTIQVPVTVAPGNYRLRVADRFSSAPIPCNLDGYGEAHDYKLTVTAPPACVTPSALAVSTITATTATMTWTAPPSAPASGYEIYYSTTTTAPTSITAPTVPNITGTTTNLTGLLPATVYYVYVRSKCSSTENSAWSVPVSFLTNCVTVAAFTENFDTTTADLPVCWEQIGTTGYVYVDTGSFASAPNVLYLEGSTFSGTALVKLPAVSTLQLGTYRLKFKLRAAYTAGGKMEVGYLATPGNPASFVGLDSFTASSTTVVDNAVVNGIYAPLGVENLYFRQTELPGEAVFIDDVVYELTPSCAEPINIATANATLSTVDLSWTAPVSVPALGYDIYYSTTNTAPTAATVPTTTSASTSTSIMLSGLTPNTLYYAWVRSNCSTSDKSPWQPVIFYTGACLPTGGSGSTSYYLNNITTTGGFTNVAYTASSYNAYIDNSATVFNSLPGGVINYNLGTSSGTNYYYIWIDYNNDLDFNDADETILATTTYSAVASGNFTIPTSIPQGSYRIRFAQSYSGAITSCGPAPYGTYVDYTLVLGPPPSCLAPTAFAVANVTSSSAALSWAASVTLPGNGYDIYYSTSSVAPTAATVLNATNSINTSASSATISGLNPASTYYVWIRSNCSSNDQSSWAAPLSFTTNCVEVTTINENFDTTPTTANPLPTCWSKIVSGAGNTYVYASTAMSSPNSLYIYADFVTQKTIVKLPAISTLSTGNYSLTFKGRANFTAGGKVEIGYMTNPSDAATFVVLGTYTTTSTTVIDNYFLNITGVPAGVKTLAFRHTADPGYSILIDDVKYDLTSALGTSENVKNGNALTIYPNPFTDIIRISEVKDVVAIIVVDLSGRTIRSVKPAREINLGDLATGMYLIQLKLKDGSVQTVKSIKK